MLDSVVLSCIFDPQYMKFTTCCRLKAVSSTFYTYSIKYMLVLKKIDFDATVEDKENWFTRGLIKRKVKWNSEFLLFQTMTEFCRNLQIVKRVCEDDEMFQPENFSKLLNLSSLVHLELFSFTANPATISVLNQLPCLKFVNFSDLILDVGEIDENEAPNTNETDYPKLNISCLEIGMSRLDFWRVIRLENLEKLIVSLGSLGKYLEFLKIVNLCPNLQALETCLHRDMLKQYDEVSELISSVESLPKFQELVLTMETSLEDLRDLVKNCPQITKYTREILILSSIFEQEDFAILFRLKQLRKINWLCFSFNHELMFKNLPNLEEVETGFDTIHYAHPGTGFFLGAHIFRSVFMKLLLSD